MKKVTLRNKFHNMSVTVIVDDEIAADQFGSRSQESILQDITMAAWAGDERAQRQKARIEKELCGDKNCCCGAVR